MAGLLLLRATSEATANPAVPCSTTIALPGSPAEFVFADFDSDARLDLVVSIPESGSAWMVRGAGPGAFATPVSVGGNGAPGALLAADFDEDGHLDLAIVHPTRDELTVHRGRGDGTFDPPTSYYAPGIPVSIGCGDFDADGDLDLAVLCQSPSRVALYSGRGTAGVGDGTFATAVLLPVGIHSYRPTRLHVADLDADGALDLVAAIPNVSRIGLLYGLKTAGVPNGGFGSMVGLSLGAVADLSIGDLDRDGFPDLSVANPAQPYVLIQNVLPNRTYPAPGYRTVAFPVTRLALGDFDGDGLPDFVGTAVDSGVFAPAAGEGWTLPLAGAVQAIAAVDVDGDGRAELALGRSVPATVQFLSLPVCGPPPPPPPPPPGPPPLFTSLSPIGRWESDGRVIVSGVGDIDGLNALPDGAGGAYLTWRDRRAVPTGEIFVLRVGPDGAPVPPWPAGGIRVRDPLGATPTGGPVRDVAGGVYVVTCQNMDCFADRFEPDGSRGGPWPAAGLQLDQYGTITSLAFPPSPDGGLLVAYGHVSHAGLVEIRVRKLAPDGTTWPGWPAEGVFVDGQVAPGVGRDRVVLTGAASDDAGGLYLAYDTFVPEQGGHGGGAAYHGDTFVRVSSAAISWRTEFSGALGTPTLISDQRGGAFGFYTSGGIAAVCSGWGTGGRRWAVPAPFDMNSFYSATGDGSGGALFVGWILNDGLRLYRADQNGAMSANGWSAAGLPLGTSSLSFLLGNLDGGVLIGQRHPLEGGGTTIRARYVTGSASTAEGWPTGGVELRSAIGDAVSARALGDGADGVFVYWLDRWNGAGTVYGQRFTPDHPVSIPLSIVDHEVEGDVVRLRWRLELREAFHATVLRRFADAGDWDARGSARDEGGGMLAWEEEVAPPGGTIEYKLVVTTGGKLIESDVVRVVVGSRRPVLSLSLPRVPLRRDDRIRISPAGGAPLVLEVFDVAGRRVSETRYEPLPGTPVECSLSALGVGIRGVALLRLRQGDVIVTRKIVVLD